MGRAVAFLLLVALAILIGMRWLAWTERPSVSALSPGSTNGTVEHAAAAGLEVSERSPVATSITPHADVSADPGMEPDPLARHAWARIRGLATGDLHPSAAECLGDPYYNPMGISLTAEGTSLLQATIDALNAEVQIANQAASMAIHEAATDKAIYRQAFVTQEELDQAREDDGVATVSVAHTGMEASRVRIYPGEYAAADARAAEARATITEGERAIRNRIRSLLNH